MKILSLYNDYRSVHGGEKAVVDTTAALAPKYGMQVEVATRSSKDLGESFAGKVGAFFSGIYSRKAYAEMDALLARERPDVVHAHNLYPLFSPSVLVAARRAGVPTVMSVHNYGLVCPHWAHLRKGQVCERCVGGRPYWCALLNCRENMGESIGYALRSAFAQAFHLFRDNVTIFIALTHFAKERLAAAGYAKERIEVLPNMVALPESVADPATGEYAAFAGRLSPEKGGNTLLAAAHLLPDIPLRLAGDGPSKGAWESLAPANARFAGVLRGPEMADFYRGARFLVVPSRWFEMCPLVILEAMANGLPVIASNIGGLPELVDDGVTGLLFEPAEAEDLAAKMRRLWEDPDMCRAMGRAARERATREHGEEHYFKRLRAIYDRAVSYV